MTTYHTVSLTEGELRMLQALVQHNIDKAGINWRPDPTMLSIAAKLRGDPACSRCGTPAPELHDYGAGPICPTCNLVNVEAIYAAKGKKL